MSRSRTVSARLRYGSHSLIADATVIAQPNGGFSLNAQELLRYLHEMIVKSGFAGAFRIVILTIQDCQPLAIVVGEVIINLGKHGFGSVSEFFQAAECCFENGAPRFLLLAIGHWRARQAQLPD